MNRSRKGTRAEHKLISLLKAQGYLVIRAAGSGHLTPDLVALKAGRAIILEVKSSKQPKVYIRPEQYEVLKRFFEEGFPCYLALYYKGKFLFFPFTSIKKAKTQFVVSLDDFHQSYLL
ncbi:MAG: hypothetical protein GXN92_00700 [Candidatus Micrarchaeota archaeon]|nr:hypothetical protein [Candidatus Micrarchaeota archaeon]